MVICLLLALASVPQFAAEEALAGYAPPECLCAVAFERDARGPRTILCTTASLESGAWAARLPAEAGTAIGLSSAPQWRVRFLPSEAGTHRILLRVRDRSGSTAEAGPFQFEVRSASQARGPVRRLPADPLILGFANGARALPAALALHDRTLERLSEPALLGALERGPVCRLLGAQFSDRCHNARSHRGMAP